MLLANLLRTLSAEELAQVRADFRLPERSRLVFERIAGSPNTPPEALSLAKAFRISTENLYRLFSEIVGECVRILAPKEEFSTMKFFRSKYLYRPFVTEMRRMEKKLLHERDRKGLEIFYGFSFNSHSEFPIDIIDIHLAEQIGNKWWRSMKAPAPDEELYIRLHVIYLLVCSYPSKKKMTLAQMSAASRALLDPVAEDVIKSPNILARFHYYLSEWKACVYERDNTALKIQWLDKVIEIIDTHPELFPPESEKAYLLLKAYELATGCGKAEEALELYKKFYNGQTPETSRGALYLKRFSIIAFLAGDFRTSRKMVEKLASFQVVRTAPTIYINALIMKSMLDIMDGIYDDAAQTIESAKALNHESFFLAYEVQLRAVETALAFKRRDLELADQLVDRNIKWLRSRRISLSTSAWIYYYQMIGSLIRNQQVHEGLRPGLMEHFTNDFKLEHPDFYILLDQDIKKIASHKKKSIRQRSVTV